MPEITDKDLASIYSNLSSCSPLVRGLAERLRRVDETLKRVARERAHFLDDARMYRKNWVETSDRLQQVRAENTALRERMKRMEEALTGIAVKTIGYISQTDIALIHTTAQAALEEGGE